MTEATKPNYKKTLNLPKTGFPMRANLAQNEPQSEKRWKKGGLYEKVIAAREESSEGKSEDAFVFHDGPPYANGDIHVGHLLNKVLKDFVVRSKMMSGKACRYVPGWDCHGLPIEHKVMTGLVESGKAEKLNALAEDARRMAIRRECRRYAEKFVKLQSGQMERLLTLADYDHPYLTMNEGYERAVLEVFGAMVEQGLVYRALKPVHWSIANQTALAEAELEYEDREDLSVYVMFDASDPAKLGEVFGVEEQEGVSFMIWTTTPWTLPANLAVAVHERYRYALVRVGDRCVVLASELVEGVMKAAGISEYEVVGETDGANLVGMSYQHPFCARESPVVAAAYVTLEDGTGLVHTAPGHGVEDYQTGLKEGLEIYCPVKGDGTYDETVPEWLRGMSVWDANGKVTEHLRESGHLFFDHAFTHSYPHDWRSKTPVIFRATEQWFVGVDAPMKREGKSLRAMALAEVESKVKFYPEWGKNRMRGMLDSRPDWCLSRQRSWGLPIPAFRTAEGKPFLTKATVKAVGEAFGERGSDCWFTDPPEAILSGYDPKGDPEAPDDLEVSTLTKMYDIFDVWFESGSSWHSVMRERGLGFPVDLYLEGSDQHRGWFQLSLLPGLAMTGASPFKAVLTHGFMVAKDGRKMSKSGGNALEVEELLKEVGADVCRWWVSSLAYENDIKVDHEFFVLAGESYRKVRNTLRFLLSNLQDFKCSSEGECGMCVAVKDMPPTSIDAYILGEAGKLQETVLAAFERYEFRKAHQAIYDFCNETVSAFYGTAVKDRLYCDPPDSERRRRTQTVMWDLVEILTRLLAPIMPHTADEAYRALRGDEHCVHECVVGDVPQVTVDPDWSKVMEIREGALKALEEAKGAGIENPLDAELVLPDPDGVLQKFAADLADLLGVSRVRFAEEGEIAVNDLRGEPKCERSWKRDGTVRERADGGMLSDRDAEAVGGAEA